MEKNRVIFFTGAGISSASGIPTFDEQPGLREKLTREFANENFDEYKNTIMNMAVTCHNAKPTAAHVAIAQSGYPVITMNIDGLHERARINENQKIVELHGRVPERTDYSSEELLEVDNIVLYGDVAPNYGEAIKMVNSLSYKNGIFVVVGTSFYTHISNYLVERARKRRAKVIVINDDAENRVPELVKTLNVLREKTDKV